MAIKIQGTTIVDDNQGLRITGVSTFTTTAGPVLIGGGTSTGTVTQPLQVTGISSGAYIGGSVGIGSTLPTSKLSVEGDARFSGVVTATTFSGQVNVGVGTITTLNFTTATGSNIVGTALSVASGIATIRTLNATNIVGTALSVATGISTLGVTSVTNLTAQQLQVTGISTFSNGPVLIGSGTSTGTASQPLQVTGSAYVSGNLGIGTNNPQGTLHVGAASTQAVVINSVGQLVVGATSGASGDSPIIIKSVGATPTPAPQILISPTTNTNQSVIQFASGGSGGFFIGRSNSSGNVTNTNGVTTFSGLNSGSYADFVGNTGNLPLLFATNNAEAMRIDSSQRVGIGTTNPTSILHLRAGTATANTAPLKINSGVVLTTPEANTFEYDGVLLYHTQNDTTNGNKRALIPEIQYQRRTSQVSISDTATPGTSIFGNTSRAALLAGNIYEVEAVVWLTKVTNAGTATLQLSLSTGNFTFASAQLNTSASVIVLNGTTSPVSLPATTSLTAGTTYGVILRGIVQPVSNARLDILLFGSTTSITVESSTFMKVTCLGTASTIGNFA